jgi:hypothetical protein
MIIVIDIEAEHNNLGKNYYIHNTICSYVNLDQRGEPRSRNPTRWYRPEAIFPDAELSRPEIVDKPDKE